MTTNLNPTYGDPAKACHYNSHAEAHLGKRFPLCGAVSYDKSSIAKGRYTAEAEHVTCKRCLRSLERQLDAIINDYVKKLAALSKAQSSVEVVCNGRNT